jgi:hypothetical protein
MYTLANFSTFFYQDWITALTSSLSFLSLTDDFNISEKQVNTNVKSAHNLATSLTKDQIQQDGLLSFAIKYIESKSAKLMENTENGLKNSNFGLLTQNTNVFNSAANSIHSIATNKSTIAGGSIENIIKNTQSIVDNSSNENAWNNSNISWFTKIFATITSWKDEILGEISEFASTLSSSIFSIATGKFSMFIAFSVIFIAGTFLMKRVYHYFFSKKATEKKQEEFVIVNNENNDENKENTIEKVVENKKLKLKGILFYVVDILNELTKVKLLIAIKDIRKYKDEKIVCDILAIMKPDKYETIKSNAYNILLPIFEENNFDTTKLSLLLQ